MRARTLWRLARGRAKYLRKAIKATFGQRPRECPLCSYRGPFLNFGTPPLFDAACPQCWSHPRHRLLQLVQTKNILIERDHDVLHFAAEVALRPMIDRIGVKRYVTADIRGIGFDLKLDIERIDLPDSSFDAVICSHVLEHVDDRRALTELRRVLRKRGKLIAMVPVVEGWSETFEDGSIQSYKDRQFAFGGGTHIRLYGRDFRERMTAAGFTLQEYSANPQETLRYSLIPGERVFVGVK